MTKKKTAALKDLSNLPDAVPIHSFDVIIGRQRKPSLRVSAIELPDRYAESGVVSNDPASMAMSMLAANDDPFGDVDFALIAKGPLEIRIYDGKGTVLATKAFIVHSAQRVKASLGSTGFALSRFGILPEARLTHTYKLTVSEKVKK